MRNWLLRWVASGIALAAVAHLGIGIHYDTIQALAFATVVLGLVNAVIRPILVLLTLPLNCLTFGLFGFALNAALFYVFGNSVYGFHVDSILGAILGPILVGFITGLMSFLLPDNEEKKK
jgi:putative membrane protein